MQRRTFMKSAGAGSVPLLAVGSATATKPASPALARMSFLCSLDYDGTRVNTDKLLWFQGRGILYNHFGKNAKHLDVARKTKDFALKHAPQPDGWWAEEFARDGGVKKPFTGDIYHPPRQMTLTILTLDRMIQRGGTHA